MRGIDAAEREYEVMLLFDTPVIFTGRRIIPSTIPDGLFSYEIQYDAEGVPICMGKEITSHFFGGTAISHEPIELNENGYRLMKDDDIVIHPDYDYVKLDEFIELFKPEQEMRLCAFTKNLYFGLHFKKSQEEQWRAAYVFCFK